MTETRTVDAIIETIGTIGVAARDRGYARAFMATLLKDMPHEVRLIAIPITARLMMESGWRKRITVDAVRDFCMARHSVAVALRPFEVTETFDPFSEFLAGATIVLANQLGLRRPA